MLRPELKMGPASWGWVERAIASIRGLERPGALEAIDTPILIVATTADQLVDTNRIITDAERLPNAELVLYGDEAAHELLREADTVRNQVVATMNRFLERLTR